MDFFNQATGQVRDLMLSMTPAARVTAVLLLGVIGVSLGYLVKHQAASPDDYLFNGEDLSASAVGRAEAAIAKAGLQGYEIVGNRIKVPRNRKSEFLAAVADAGALPPNFHKIVEDALDISPFASGDTRREKLKAAREQQLSLLVSDMDGIAHAKVIFDIQEAQGLARRGQATATVSVKPDAGESLNAKQIKMIQKAVAGGIAELKPDHVVVTNSGDGSSFGGGDEISPDSFENDYYQTKLAFEEKMQSKIDHLLRDIPGTRVQVIAELEDTLERTTKSLTPEVETAALRTSSTTETDKVSEVDNGGRPGLEAQGPRRIPADDTAVVVKNDRTVQSDESDNFVGNRQEYTRSAALVPKNVRAAITVPTNYLLSIWNERERLKGNNPPGQPSTEDLDGLRDPVIDSIKAIVVPLLPKELAKNNLSDVQVSFFDTITPDPIEPPSTASQLLGWAGKNFSTMTMAVVALVGLVMLRSMVKSIPAPEPAAAIERATLALDTVEGAQPAAAGELSDDGDTGRPRLRLKKGDSLKDDLTEIVREDPDAAAAILRSWIGNAG